MIDIYIYIQYWPRCSELPHCNVRPWFPALHHCGNRVAHCHCARSFGIPTPWHQTGHEYGHWVRDCGETGCCKTGFWATGKKLFSWTLCCLKRPDCLFSRVWCYLDSCTDVRSGLTFLPHHFASWKPLSSTIADVFMVLVSGMMQRFVIVIFFKSESCHHFVWCLPNIASISCAILPVRALQPTRRFFLLSLPRWRDGSMKLRKTWLGWAVFAPLSLHPPRAGNSGLKLGVAFEQVQGGKCRSRELWASTWLKKRSPTRFACTTVKFWMSCSILRSPSTLEEMMTWIPNILSAAPNAKCVLLRASNLHCTITKSMACERKNGSTSNQKFALGVSRLFTHPLGCVSTCAIDTIDVGNESMVCVNRLNQLAFSYLTTYEESTGSQRCGNIMDRFDPPHIIVNDFMFDELWHSSDLKGKKTMHGGTLLVNQHSLLGVSATSGLRSMNGLVARNPLKSTSTICSSTFSWMTRPRISKLLEHSFFGLRQSFMTIVSWLKILNFVTSLNMLIFLFCRISIFGISECRWPNWNVNGRDWSWASLLCQDVFWGLQRHARQGPTLSNQILVAWQRMSRREDAGGFYVVLYVFPTPEQGPYYVVHLYAGRRRPQDFHAHMTQLIGSCTESWASNIYVISIDTAISEDMNVHGEALWSFLLTAARAGRILGLLLGPPCETWSNARFAKLVDANGEELKGPRPLRSAAECWGIQGLSLAELQQIGVSNTLLLRGLWLCLPVAMTGGAVLLEHPAPATQMDRPAIWRTSLVLLYLREGWLFRRHTFKQGAFGAPGVKPTSLLYANNQIGNVLDEFAQPCNLDHLELLVGRDELGRFRTSRAKEYPDLLCRCFAISFWRHIGTLQLSTKTEAVDQLAAKLADISGRVDPTKEMKPDYQPTRW